MVYASQYIGANAHKQTRPSHQKPSYSQQSHKCWTFARGFEACALIRCFCSLWKPKTQCTEKTNTKKRFYKNNFRKIIISYLILDARRDLHTFKYKRPHNKPFDAWFWKPANGNQALHLYSWNKICMSVQKDIWLTDSNVSLSSQVKKFFFKKYWKYALLRTILAVWVTAGYSFRIG